MMIHIDIGEHGRGKRKKDKYRSTFVPFACDAKIYYESLEAGEI